MHLKKKGDQNLAYINIILMSKQSKKYLVTRSFEICVIITICLVLLDYGVKIHWFLNILNQCMPRVFFIHLMGIVGRNLVKYQIQVFLRGGAPPYENSNMNVLKNFHRHLLQTLVNARM